MDTKTFLGLLESNVQLKKDNAALAKVAGTALTISSTLAKNNNLLKNLIKELLDVSDTVPEELINRCKAVINK